MSDKKLADPGSLRPQSSAKWQNGLLLSALDDVAAALDGEATLNTLRWIGEW